jgi:hypothetical protein
MNNFSLKQKIIGAVVVIGLILIVIFQRGLYSSSGGNPVNSSQNEPSSATDIQLVKTNPSPLNDATILPNQTIEFTFNKELVNDPTKRVLFEPEVDYKIELSSDRKTVKIILNKPYELGAFYRVTIKPELKFEGDKTLNREENFNFKTIDYSGV